MSWAPWKEQGTVPVAVGLPVSGLVRQRPAAWRVVAGIVYFSAVGVWAAFLVTMAVAPDTLDSIWQWFSQQDPMLRVAGWLVALPWTAALAAWESSWPVLIRFVIVVALAFGTVLAYAPRPRDHSF